MVVLIGCGLARPIVMFSRMVEIGQVVSGLPSWALGGLELSLALALALI